MKNPAGSETVLLVDDDEIVREVASLVLSSRGFRVIKAHDGMDGLQASATFEGPIHVLLTDLAMPEVDGVELYRRLAQSRPDMKVVFMSGYSRGELEERGALANGCAFIQKPFSPSALASHLRAVLDAPRS